jgi:hypothetical protein
VFQGNYLLVVENPQTAAFTAYLPLSAIYWVFFNGQGAESPMVQIMPVACNADALYLAEMPQNGVPVVTLQVTLRQNYQDTTLQCNMSSSTPTSCPVGNTVPITAGDLLDYAVTFPSALVQNSQYQLLLSLHCQ